MGLRETALPSAFFRKVQFRFLSNRQKNKEIYYQVNTLINEPKKSLISIYRLYYNNQNIELKPVNNNIFSFYKENKIDLLKEIDFNDEGFHYIEFVKEAFDKLGLRYFSGLDIWNKSDFMKDFDDPRTFIYKLLHVYLRSTEPFSKKLIVRLTDKILKILGV